MTFRAMKFGFYCKVLIASGNPSDNFISLVCRRFRGDHCWL